MDLDWTTFLLQILNFLVLVWILRRFLYRPVMEAVARRREAIVEVGRQAEEARAEGAELEDRYRQRLDEWEREREQARGALHRELEHEREEGRAKLAQELKDEREKARVVVERDAAERQLELERVALGQGTRFVSRLLSRVAGPDLEQRLIDMLLEDLERLPAPERRALGEACRDEDARLELWSAFPLRADQRDRIVEALRSVGGRELPLEPHVDESLLAGVRIGVGAWALRAALRDELEYFAEAAHAQR